MVDGDQHIGMHAGGVAVYPSWKKGKYMNLLKHKNVRVIMRFARDSFVFLPPDHWKDSGEGGKAKWQVLVIEIANEAGLAKYKVGDERDIARAGEALGARLIPEDRHCGGGGGSGAGLPGWSNQFRKAPSRHTPKKNNVGAGGREEDMWVRG